MGGLEENLTKGFASLIFKMGFAVLNLTGLLSSVNFLGLDNLFVFSILGNAPA